MPTMNSAKGMQFIFIMLAIALMGCFCSMQPQLQILQITDFVASKKEFVEGLEDKTIALISVNSEGKLAAYCSGVWVATNKILTAAHCVESKDITLYMVKSDIEKDVARLAIKVKVDEKSDLALLLTELKSTPPHRTALISKEKPYAGLKIYIEGHTTGLWWTYSEGVVSSNIRSLLDQSKTPAIQISSSAWFGNSGGGAFNDNGELVGLCSWISVKGPNLTFFVPNDVLRDFVKKD